MSIDNQQSDENTNLRIRLRDARQALGLTQADLGRLWNYEGNYVYMLEAGKKPIPKKLVLKVVDLEKEVRIKFAAPPARFAHPLTDSLPVGNLGGPYWGASDEAPVVSPTIVGTPHTWKDAGHAAPRVKVNCQDPNCYVVEVWGDSMAPIYQRGDLLVIAPNMQPQPQDLVVIKTTKEEPYFKKYLGSKNGLHRFASFNPNYEILEFKPEELFVIHAVHSVIRGLKGRLF